MKRGESSGQSAVKLKFTGSKMVGDLSFEEYFEMARRFHGYPAPGLLLGGYMVEEAKRHFEPDVLLDAICETSWCLPDAVQILTPCSIGNGWLRILDFGRYAVTLYDKMEGSGVRVALNPGNLTDWPNLADWYLKRKPKKDQDSDMIRQEIGQAGATVCTLERVLVPLEKMRKRSKGRIVVCPICSEAYPAMHGAICRGCQGEAPYRDAGLVEETAPTPRLKKVPVDDAQGLVVLHDMTRIVPGRSKGPAFKRGQTLDVGDVCRLQQMGRRHLYVEVEGGPGEEWVHEDAAAEAFAAAMAGPGIGPAGPPREGKVTLEALQDGLFIVDEQRLEQFNQLPEVMAASRKAYSLVRKGSGIAATRAIPLYLRRELSNAALQVLEEGPLFEVRVLKPSRVGILVTGSEVFQGLIEDRFEPVVTEKVTQLGCRVVKSMVAPDDIQAIATCLRSMIVAGCELVVTTAGLSVDPDDVTRKGLIEAGVSDILYGMPVLPGAMTLLGRLGQARVIGVPACALFFKTTSFDILLPRLLAGVEINRKDLSRLGNGGMCLECKACTYPKCPFGK